MNCFIDSEIEISQLKKEFIISQQQQDKSGQD